MEDACIWNVHGANFNGVGSVRQIGPEIAWLVIGLAKYMIFTGKEHCYA